MERSAVRPLSTLESVEVGDLSATTIGHLADQLSQSSTFEELVYRESEMDALFSLVDIAISTSRADARPAPSTMIGALGLGADDLVALRELIVAAHDLTHDEDIAAAVTFLRSAARLVLSRAEPASSNEADAVPPPAPRN